MPLIGSATTWRDSIIATIDTTDLNASELTKLNAFWLSICQVHETHITANSLINTIVTGTSPSGPVTGTGLGTPPVTGIL